MKQALVIALILYCCVERILAQSEYEVQKIKGKVELVSLNNKPLYKGVILNGNDIIRIKVNSSITLIDKKNYRLYDYSVSGEHRTSQIVEKCIKNGNSITSQIVNEIKNNIIKGDEKNLRSVGAVRRGTDDELELLYSAIINRINNNNPNNCTDVCLKYTIKDGKDIVLTIENNTSNILYSNVLSWKDNSIPQFCYVNELANLIIEPFSSLTIDKVKFLCSGQSFILVCSYSEFDIEPIQNMLNEGEIPDFSYDKESDCITYVLETNQ